MIKYEMEKLGREWLNFNVVKIVYHEPIVNFMKHGAKHTCQYQENNKGVHAFHCFQYSAWSLSYSNITRESNKRDINRKRKTQNIPV